MRCLPSFVCITLWRRASGHLLSDGCRDRGHESSSGMNSFCPFESFLLFRETLCYGRDRISIFSDFA